MAIQALENMDKMFTDIKESHSSIISLLIKEVKLAKGKFLYNYSKLSQNTLSKIP